jgi:signal transduction histidine kinase
MQVALEPGRRLLPRGRPISDDLWRSRHRTVVRLLVAHLVALCGYGIVRSFPVWHLALELGAIAAVTAIAQTAGTRNIQSAAGTVGLVSCSGLLVHLSGGLIEAHFHFFIVVILVTLYQSWVPFVLAMVFVLIHHGTVGVLDPGSVYNHQAAIDHPWTWAGVHALFVTGAAVAALASWKHAEVERERAEEAAVRLHARELRQREAVQLNDTIVQGLVAAKYAAQAGLASQSAEAVDRTLTLAKQLVAEMMDADDEFLARGGLRRAEAAMSVGDP